MQGLKLYHYWRSSCSWRVRWAFFLKGIEAELIHIHLVKGEQKEKDFEMKNPMQLVPVLEFSDGKKLTESLAIIQWAEEKIASPPLLGEDTWSRAKILELSHLIASSTQPKQNIGVLNYFSEEPGQKKKWAQYWIEIGLKAYEEIAKETAREYSVGSTVSLADLCLAPQVYNAKRYEVDLEPTPTVKRIFDRLTQTPGYQNSAPENFEPKK